MSASIAESAHPLEKSAPSSGMQAYIASTRARQIFEALACSGLENVGRNGCRNAQETVVL